MPVVQVTIAEKADPVLGKKRGRVKDTEGRIFQVPPMMLDMVHVGGTFELSYKDDSYGDTKFRVIEGIKPMAGAAPSTQQTATPRPSPMASTTPAYDQYKDESISVLAIIKCQQLPVGDRAGILHALKASALAWRDFKKWQKDGNIETGRQPLHDDGYPDDV